MISDLQGWNESTNSVMTCKNKGCAPSLIQGEYFSEKGEKQKLFRRFADTRQTELVYLEAQMDKTTNITEQLAALIHQDHFPVSTLAEYMNLSPDQVTRLAEGDMSFLPDENSARFVLFNKIAFLYSSAAEDKDTKLTAFLQVLLSYHHLSKKTIAAMAGVTPGDVDAILANPPKEVPAEIKYKLAVTVMALRFFLKDCEPEGEFR